MLHGEEHFAPRHAGSSQSRGRRRLQTFRRVKNAAPLGTLASVGIEARHMWLKADGVRAMGRADGDAMR
eukprot:2527395-Pleurochrysis_carterae.AAC.1